MLSVYNLCSLFFSTLFNKLHLVSLIESKSPLAHRCAIARHQNKYTINYSFIQTRHHNRHNNNRYCVIALCYNVSELIIRGIPPSLAHLHIPDI